jgi:hypothetical protein
MKNIIDYNIDTIYFDEHDDIDLILTKSAIE